MKRPHLKPHARSVILEALGALLVSVGLALIYLPAGVVAAGLVLAAFGLLVVDVDEKP